MSARERVAALVRRYDDEAWVALANRGLLRRAAKDLERLDVHLMTEDVDAVTVAVGDREVRIPESGPSAATCSCPSAVVCQHVLTACLWLARAGEDAPAESRDSETEQADPDRLHEELMAFDAAALTAYAGGPGLRWAHQLLTDLDAEGDAEGQEVGVERATYLAVRLPRPNVTVRYLGGGLDGLVLDQKVPHPERVRVAAVLAWQRAHGRELAAPPPPRSRAGETELSRSRAESRARLRAAVATLLADTVRTGVSHLSAAVQERYTTLAVWAQGAEYHRLSLHLRRLADQCELLLDRDSTADDRRLLDEVAVTYGLVRALESAASAGREPVSLVGRARTGYDPARSLALVGLGGSPWRSGTGYHGLTCVFWSPDRQRFLTWTDARPVSVPGFDPRARWDQPGPWAGLGSPATTAGRALALTNAQVNPSGRLSGVETTAARVSPLDSDDLLQQLPLAETWEGLAERHGGRGRSLLSPPDATERWAVVRPAAYGAVRFDHNRQTLLWSVSDVTGAVLRLELPWARHHAHAIGRIERLGELPDGTALVLRMRTGSAGLVGEPMSLVLPGRPINPVDSLHFDQAAAARQSSLVATLEKAGAPDRTDDEDAPSRSSPAPLAALRAWLEEQAERGTAGANAPALVGQLSGRHRTLRGVGLHVFPEFGEKTAGEDPAELLLRSHYLVQQVELVLG